ncbi:hypothetical protein T03_381 [Trichinella britovi]|uniref:Uncharacterized protein n=1 Tax=Trichinella britovi TaxID=45882 RepID=A0A0V0ZQ17_TRIBR|nr:hypothetical protein T03_381 [Trichinella britovi]
MLRGRRHYYKNQRQDGKTKTPMWTMDLAKQCCCYGSGGLQNHGMKSAVKQTANDEIDSSFA